MTASRTWIVFTAALLLAGGAAVYLVIDHGLRTGEASMVVAGLSFLVLCFGGFCLYVREKRLPSPPPERPRVEVDWHLSDVYLKVTCTCTPGIVRKLDGYTFGRFRCPDCKSTYRLPEILHAHE